MFIYIYYPTSIYGEWLTQLGSVQDLLSSFCSSWFSGILGSTMIVVPLHVPGSESPYAQQTRAKQPLFAFALPIVDA